MNITSGTRLGPYEILSEIGAGAMGVVYKARDTRLGRDVAIKVLPSVFARDQDRLGRFEREARAVAAINHPNILSVHDIGSADVVDAKQETVRTTYMVTELLDGETLRTRLAQGPLPVRKAIDVAGQIAQGLAAAHDRGIIHRDLKPDNLVLLRDGHVKILDFGLAKTLEVTGADRGTERRERRGMEESSTMLSPAMTDAGTVLGTVGYMAPEQVRGESADARTDLFALGAVLYELVSGQRAFARNTAVETMTAILREDPPELTAPVEKLSPAIGEILMHALEKEPSARFQSARDFAFALRAISVGAGSGSMPAVPATAAAPKSRRAGFLGWAVAAVVAVAAVAGYFSLAPKPAVSGSRMVFAPVLPWRDGRLSSPAVAPDSNRIAFIDRQAEGDVIVVRNLTTLQSQTLKGTIGVRPYSLFWSPDGSSLGFFAGGKLKTVEISSGEIDYLADAPSGSGGTWGPDGTILFNPDERAPIFRVSKGGGAAKPVTTVEKPAESHRWPQFLPDGHHFIFLAWRTDSVRRPIQIASLSGGPPKTLFESDSAAVVGGNYYIFVRDLPSQLLAQPFNPTTFDLEGRAVPLIEDDNVDFAWFNGESRLSASPRLLVYTTGKRIASIPTWYSRTGQFLNEIGGPRQVFYDPAISPDGTTLALEAHATDLGSTDLFTVDLDRGAGSALTSAPGFESTPTWSPDSKRIAFSSDQNSPSLRVKNVGSPGDGDILLNQRGYASSWSRDGRYLLFNSPGGATGWDVWLYDFQTKEARAFINSPVNEFGAVISPDGKLVAYCADESRDAQIFIRAFSDASAKIAVTASGGRQPSWSKTGDELFFLAPDTTLMAVKVKIGTPVTSDIVGEPKALFRTNVDPSRVIRNQYVVTPDGQRIMVLSPVVHPDASPLIGILNWMPK